MILQKHDVELFKEWGYSEEHISKIQKAIEVSTYELCEAEAPYNTVKFLTASEAYKKLGHIEFLSGVARSTFSLHYSKNCATDKKHSVFFNSKSLYKVY